MERLLCVTASFQLQSLNGCTESRECESRWFDGCCLNSKRRRHMEPKVQG